MIILSISTVLAKSLTVNGSRNHARQFYSWQQMHCTVRFIKESTQKIFGQFKSNRIDTQFMEW